MKSLNDLIIERQKLEKQINKAETLEERNKLQTELKAVQTMIDAWGTQSNAVYRIV